MNHFTTNSQTITRTNKLEIPEEIFVYRHVSTLALEESCTVRVVLSPEPKIYAFCVLVYPFAFVEQH